MFSHFQGIDIKVRFGIFFQRRFLAKTLEVRGRLRIDLVGVKIGSRSKFDFGAGHSEKAQRIAFRKRGGFFGIHDIIRNGGDSRDFFRYRHQSMKG